MKHWRSDMRRYQNNQRQKELDREERWIREDVQQVLSGFADAEPETEFEGMGFDNHELVRFANSVVQFQTAADESRELDPSWLRGFAVSTPVPTEDDFDDDDMEGPRRLPHGWFEQNIFQQVLEQAGDYEGELTSTSFDPDWLLGMRIRVLREEIAGKGFEITAVRKREDSWVVFLCKKPHG